MVRSVDFQSRRKAVLAAAIDRYIQNALPVASDSIADEFDLSSATIRSIFADLEKEGYITHPYTSGGRVPTEKGYRYYVDFLLSQMELFEEEKRRIEDEYHKVIKEIELVLEATSEVISEITRNAAIVYFHDRQDRFFYRGLSQMLEQPEFEDSKRARMLIRFIEDRDRLLELINRSVEDKVSVYIGKELDVPEMDSCSLVVSGFQRNNKPSGRLAVLGPARMRYARVIPAMEYISDMLGEVLSSL